MAKVGTVQGELLYLQHLLRGLLLLLLELRTCQRGSQSYRGWRWHFRDRQRLAASVEALAHQLAAFQVRVGVRNLVVKVSLGQVPTVGCVRSQTLPHHAVIDGNHLLDGCVRVLLLIRSSSAFRQIRHRSILPPDQPSHQQLPTDLVLLLATLRVLLLLVGLLLLLVLLQRILGVDQRRIRQLKVPIDLVAILTPASLLLRVLTPAKQRPTLPLRLHVNRPRNHILNVLRLHQLQRDLLLRQRRVDLNVLRRRTPRHRPRIIVQHLLAVLPPTAQQLLLAVLPTVRNTPTSNPRQIISQLLLLLLLLLDDLPALLDQDPPMERSCPHHARIVLHPGERHRVRVAVGCVHRCPSLTGCGIAEDQGRLQVVGVLQEPGLFQQLIRLHTELLAVPVEDYRFGDLGEVHVVGVGCVLRREGVGGGERVRVVPGVVELTLAGRASGDAAVALADQVEVRVVEGRGGGGRG
uniref:(northern house mosquito) hypothetical protein n=1 Tax=Culex pipiens TaxID=7175 RepID=A0A8D8BL52_CULPI